MSSRSYDFPTPDAFTAGTVGPPGQRVFYLQVRERGVLLTLKIEKEQVAALADYLADLLAKLPAGADPEGALADVPLEEPIAPAWAVRSLAVGYDTGRDRIVIVAEERREDDEEGTEEEAEQAEQGEGERPKGASVRVVVNRQQAGAFVERARKLVAGGRPPCPICGGPMNPEGHACPRRNGASRG